jgi:hypothetical protein
MIHTETKKHIQSLSDSDLLEYVLTGRRHYEEEAIAFAKAELDRRNLSEERLSELRPSALAKVAVLDATASVDISPIPRTPAILCQSCKIESPTAFVHYRQNVGLVHIRFVTSYKGDFCKRCNRRFFRKATLWNFFCGWWGVVSFFATIYYLIDNTLTCIRTITLPLPPPGAAPPQLDDRVTEKIAPHLDPIIKMLHDGEDATDIANQYAPIAGVTPGQVWCFIQIAIQQQAASPSAVDSKFSERERFHPSI